MKNITSSMFVLTFVFTLMSCGSTTNSANSADKKVSVKTFGNFKSANFNSCMIRQNNRKYCECFSEVMDKNTTHALKEKTLNNPSDSAVVRQISAVMQENTNQISACNKHIEIAKTDKANLSTTHTSDVLKRNEGQVLTPMNLGALKMLDKPIGYIMQFLDAQKSMRPSAAYRLAKFDGRKYYFDYLYSDGRVAKDKYYWEDGIEYIRVGEDYRIRSPLDSCRFTLGRCSAKSTNGRVMDYLVEYKDGVWYYSFQKFRTSITELVIYDLYGLPLYSKYHIYGRDSHIEYVR